MVETLRLQTDIPQLDNQAFIKRAARTWVPELQKKKTTPAGEAEHRSKEMRIAVVVKLYESGLSLQEIQVQTLISIRTLKAHLRREGFTI